MTTNKKKLLIADSMGKAGWDLLAARDDIEATSFSHLIKPADFVLRIRAEGGVDGVIIGPMRFGEAELAEAPRLRVVARIGVGYDSVDVPALTKRGIPLMVVGIANSPSVAEQAIFFMMTLARRGAYFDALVKQGRWPERLKVKPVDLLGKTALIVGFGRIGTRTAKRCLAMEMRVLVYDPYVPAESVRAAGCEPARDLDAAVAEADFVTLHCPKTPETLAMFDDARLRRMKPTAYLVNTARGGIVEETALHAALSEGRLAGAGLDVFALEPAPADNPLLKLPNVVTAPHMAGVTVEAVARMALAAVRNVLSVFDGQPIRENVINQEVLG